MVEDFKEFILDERPGMEPRWYEITRNSQGGVIAIFERMHPLGAAINMIEVNNTISRAVLLAVIKEQRQTQ